MCRGQVGRGSKWWRNVRDVKSGRVCKWEDGVRMFEGEEHVLT